MRTCIYMYNVQSLYEIHIIVLNTILTEIFSHNSYTV